MNPMSTAVRGTLFIVSAPSGAGKTSLLEALRQRLPTVSLSISHTTRPPRPGEVDGQHYYFVSEWQFLDLVENGDLLEHAQVFDHFYGTSRNAVMAQLDTGVDVILEIDWQGARLVRKAIPEACTLFILPPSRAELERRLRLRAQDDEAVIQRRLRDAANDMTHYQEYDYIVINEDFAQAVSDLECIFRTCRLRTPDLATRYRPLIAELLAGADAQA